jgi:hypothetical protein
MEQAPARASNRRAEGSASGVDEMRADETAIAFLRSIRTEVVWNTTTEWSLVEVCNALLDSVERLERRVQELEQKEK